MLLGSSGVGGGSGALCSGDDRRHFFLCLPRLMGGARRRRWCGCPSSPFTTIQMDAHCSAPQCSGSTIKRRRRRWSPRRKSVSLHTTQQRSSLQHYSTTKARGLGSRKCCCYYADDGGPISSILDLTGQQQLVSGAGPRRRRPTPVGPKRREARCCSHTLLTSFCTHCGVRRPP